MDSKRLKHMERLADLFYEHLELGTCEYGGWGLDDKRPFGSTSADVDILDALEIEPDGELFPDEDEREYSESQCEYAGSLYGELGDFLRLKWEEYKVLRGGVE